MPQVRWAEGPPAPPPLPRVHWLVARCTRGVYAVLSGRALVGAYTHWEAPCSTYPRGKRVPCLLADCEHCGRGRLGTRYWWVSACRPKSSAACILELSEGAAVQLAALAPDPHSLRGLRVHVYRRDQRPRSPQEVRLVDSAAELPYELPPPSDVLAHLEEYWGLAPGAYSDVLPDWTPDGRAVRPQQRRAYP